MHWLDERVGDAKSQAANALPAGDLHSNLDFFRRSPDNQRKYTKYLQYKAILQLLNNAGITGPAGIYAAAQVLHETGGQKNVDNNYGGIVFVGQPGATKGRPLPLREQTKTIKNYAHYDSPQQWAADFKRVISMNKGAGAPINVTDAGPHGYQEYVKRLRANGYFRANTMEYLTGMYNQINQIQDLIKWVNANARQIDAATVKSNQYYPATSQFKQNDDAFDKKDKNSFWKKHPILTGVAIALGVVVVVKVVK